MSSIKLINKTMAGPKPRLVIEPPHMETHLISILYEAA